MQGSKQAIKGNHGANRQGANAGQTRNNQQLSNNINKIDQTKEEQVCNICAQNVPGLERKKIFAFGKCDHHVCYVCSARLRVVCDQLDCPICRDKLDMVSFTTNLITLLTKHNMRVMSVSNITNLNLLTILRLFSLTQRRNPSRSSTSVLFRRMIAIRSILKTILSRRLITNFCDSNA